MFNDKLHQVDKVMPSSTKTKKIKYALRNFKRMLTDLILKSFRYWKEKPQQEETVDVGKTIERRKTEIQWTALVNAKIDGRDDGVVRQRRRFIYGRDRSAVQGSGRSGHTTTFFRRWLRNERSFVSRRPVLTLALSHYAPTDFFRPEFLVRQKKRMKKQKKTTKKDQQLLTGSVFDTFIRAWYS